MDGNWAVWGSWGLCNTQTGKKERRRECNNPEPINGGATCLESDTEEVSCPGKKTTNGTLSNDQVTQI